MGAGGDPFRRVRPGEAVRLTATAWNALMDLVRPTGATAQSGATVAYTLPSVVGTLSGSGVYVAERKLVMGEAVALVAASDSDGAEATVPLAVPMTFSAVERRLWNGYRTTYQTMYPDQGTSVTVEDPFAICIDPPRLRFAMSGLAWVRVRALRRWHRFARRCLVQPGDTATEKAASIGCLDSCGWGPAEIVGWATDLFDPQAIGAGQLTTTSAVIDRGAAGGIYWALVRF